MSGLREINVCADEWNIETHRYGYNSLASKFSPVSSLEKFCTEILPKIQHYDVFHFHARSFLVGWPQNLYPTAYDILLLKLLGKRVFFHFRGSEARLKSEHLAQQYNYVDEDIGWLYDEMPDQAKVKLREALAAVCDGLFAVDEEIRSYVPGSHLIPRALDGRDWQFVGVSDRKRPLVVHAPSRKSIKGTRSLLAAVDILQKEGQLFDFKLVDHLPHEQAIDIYRSADVIVDQLRIGWHGVLAVEGMALGKPVISYLRHDLASPSNRPPIVNANPDTITDVLRGLINQRARRHQLGRDGRAFFERHHEAKVVAKQLKQHYDKPCRPIGPMEINEFTSALARPVPKHSPAQRLHMYVKRFGSTAHDDGLAEAASAVARFARTRMLGRKRR